VKKNKSVHGAVRLDQEPSPASAGLWPSWTRFWFEPIDPVGLHVLRVLTGLLFLAWLAPFAGHLDAMFGLHGWFDKQAYAEAGRLPGAAPQLLGWSALYLCGGNPLYLQITYGVSLCVLALFTLGVWVRLTAVLSWVAVVSFSANPATEYDADGLLVVLAFYLMLGYLSLGQREPGQSLAARLLGPGLVWWRRRSARAAAAQPQRSTGAGLALRLLQVHVALVVLVSGLHKLQFGDWWAGVALWYPLHPPLATDLPAVRSYAPFAVFYLTVLSLAAYATMAWQLSFPLFAWRPRWRPVLLAGAVIGWLGTAFLYELPLFGPVLCIGCLAYLSASEWRRLFAGLAAVPGWLGKKRRPATWAGPHSTRATEKEEADALVAARNS
jgi:hypothetical protein